MRDAILALKLPEVSLIPVYQNTDLLSGEDEKQVGTDDSETDTVVG